MVLLPEDALAPCGRLVQRAFTPFDQGFDFAATRGNGNRAVGVDPQGPAYAAGLREGMQIVGGGGEIGNPEREFIFTVREADVEREIRYLPRGRDSVIGQEMQLAAPLEGETLAQCLRVLGGA